MDRQEAIRRIREWNLNSDDMEVLGELIPELKMSEDERMKAYIYDELNGLRAREFNEGGEGSDRYVELCSAIAWLEKQSFTDNLLTVKRAREVSPYCDNQKFAEWSDEDEKILNFILNDLFYMFKQDHKATALYDIETKWLKSIKSLVKPLWSPSKEQLESLEKAAKYFGGCDPDDLGPNLESLYINLKGL